MEFKNFGHFLSEKRLEKKITMREMAKQLGCSAPFLSDVEKDRRNPFETEKLALLAEILSLSSEDKATMYDLAGKKRNTIAPDLPEYICKNDYVSAALRVARDMEADERDWLRFVEELKNRKNNEQN